MKAIQQTEINEITRLHNEIEESLRMSLQKAIRIGELLSKAKDELKHGEFIPWIEKNLSFTDRTARRYIRIFENQDKVLQAGNITEAYKILEEHKSDTVSILINTDNIEQDILEILEEIKDFWKNLSKNLPGTIDEMKKMNDESFQLNMAKEDIYRNYMDNEFKIYIDGIFNMPEPENYDAWISGLKKFANLDKTLKKMQNLIGEIVIYKNIVKVGIEDRLKICRKRMRDLKLKEEKISDSK